MAFAVFSSDGMSESRQRQGAVSDGARDQGHRDDREGGAEEREHERGGAKRFGRAGELVAVGDAEDDERAHEHREVHECVPAPIGEPAIGAGAGAGA